MKLLSLPLMMNGGKSLMTIMTMKPKKNSMITRTSGEKLRVGAALGQRILIRAMKSRVMDGFWLKVGGIGELRVVL